MVRVLHVGDFGQMKLGRRYYTFERRVHYGLLRNDYCLFELSDKDLVKCASPFNVSGVRVGRKSIKFGVRSANRCLLESVDNFRPDLLLLSNCMLIADRTLRDARALLPSVVIAGYTCDPLFSRDNRAHQVRRLQVCDALFVTTAGRPLAEFAREGPARVHHIPNPVDPSVDYLNNFEREDLPCDLLFLGTDAPDTERVRFIDGLRRELADVDFRVHGMLGSARVEGWRYVRALSEAKGGLNANKHEQTLYSSDRIACLMGNGLLCYIHRDSELDRFLDADKAVFFSGADDLAESVRTMRADDARRRAVAGSGTRFYRQHFSSRLVSRFMVEAALELPLSGDYIWPSESF